MPKSRLAEILKALTGEVVNPKKVTHSWLIERINDAQKD
jgi:hypothetical protein